MASSALASSSSLPAPAPIQTFALAEDRARLTRAAVGGVSKIAAAWRLTGAETAALLGMSESTWDRARRGARQEPLTQDQLTRASALIGIFKGLRLLFADDMADRWPRLPNGNLLFAGRSPIAAMLEGGIPRMLDIRRLIDAVRGGL